MALVSSQLPTIIKSPWPYSGFYGGVGCTAYKITSSPTTIYLENTSSAPIVVGLDISAVGAFKIELFDNVTFTAGTVIDGINANRAFSTAAVNSPMRFYSTATSVTLGSAIWTWQGGTEEPLQVFGPGSLTGAHLVLAGNTKSAVTITASGGGGVDLTPSDGNMDSASVTQWPDVPGSNAVQSKVAGGPVGGVNYLQIATTLDTDSRVTPLTPIPFVAGVSYFVSVWMKGAHGEAGESSYTCNAQVLLPDATSFNVAAAPVKDEDVWVFKSKTLIVEPGYEGVFQLRANETFSQGGLTPHADFDNVVVTQIVSVPVALNFSYTLWDGSLLGDV